MTTTDLVAEMLRNFRAEIMSEVRREIRKAIKPHFTTKPLPADHDQSRGCGCQSCAEHAKTAVLSMTPRNKIEVKCRECDFNPLTFDCRSCGTPMQ